MVDTYAFEGVIETTSLGLLFGGKSVGQTFSGTFTIDRGAMLVFVGNDGQYTSWDGDFQVVVEGVPYAAQSFSVWSSGPVGIDDGFEFAFATNEGTGFLSMRSSLDLYAQPLIPTSVDIADMDTLSRVSVSGSFPSFDYDQGEITFVPEPGAAGLAAVACAALATLRRRAGASRRA